MRYLGYQPKKNEADDMIWEALSSTALTSASASASASQPQSRSRPRPHRLLCHIHFSDSHLVPHPYFTDSHLVPILKTPSGPTHTHIPSRSDPIPTLPPFLIPHPMTLEVDENGDGAIDWEEFQLMYAVRRIQPSKVYQPSKSSSMPPLLCDTHHTARPHPCYTHMLHHPRRTHTCCTHRVRGV